MATGSDVKFIGDEELIRKLERIRRTFSKKLMAEIGELLMTNIKVRTARGVDVEEQAFEPYSTGYAFFRAKSGRPVDKVDLFFTGSMLSSMTFEEKRTEVRVFFMPTQDQFGMSNPEKAYYLNEKRRFFAISDDDAQEIELLIKDAFSDAIRSRN